MEKPPLYIDVSRAQGMALQLRASIGAPQTWEPYSRQGLERGCGTQDPTLPHGSLLQADEAQALHQESGALQPMGAPRHQQRKLVFRGWRMAVLLQRQAYIVVLTAFVEYWIFRILIMKKHGNINQII